MSTFTWGVIGPGKIAHSFAAAIKVCPDTVIGAVASHSLDKANAFADEFGIAKRYDSYEAFVADPELDAVYISTTNPYHYDCIKLALNAGKPVLCEKPMCLNEAQTEDVVRLAREKKLFLMEAVWSRFLPIFAQVEAWLAEGRIGEPEMIRADFAFTAPFPENDRHVDLQNGGGALLDLGIYTLDFALRYFGSEPEEILSAGSLYRTGVDGKSVSILRYEGGRIAVLTSGITFLMDHDATIYGSGGSIHIPNFWRPVKAQLNRIVRPFTPPEVEVAETDWGEGNGYQYELLEAMACIRAGKLESPRMPHADSLALSRIMTGLRRGWGVKYEGNFGE